MGVLIKTVRVAGLRGLENIEVPLEKTTILTGMNNTGKTSLLKALQLALGNRQFVSQDDFFIHGNAVSKSIIVDLLIVPMSSDGRKIDSFSEGWEELFTVDRIRLDEQSNATIPIRTIISFDAIKNSFKSEQQVLQTWPPLEQGGINWFDAGEGKKTSFHFDEMPFFYMDAQRDILEDTKLRTSYVGKMLSKIEYSKEDIEEIETQINSLNEKAVISSPILSNIKTALKELDTAMDTNSEGIEITPFTKKIRDLSKGLTIYYTDQQDSFSMEYHGMGTRSWSSLLTLKAFISLLSTNASHEQSVFFPVLAIEEPESHLHPNAQKKLYGQLDSIPGQKIISTHSPYIAAVAELGQIRNLYKAETVHCGRIKTENIDGEGLRKISRQVINTRGEIFFSKLIVFFEGETEEQALPIFSQNYFKRTPVEMGVDFIGVGGFGSYLPFLQFAEALNLPWLVFSDAENTPGKNIKAQVQKQFENCGATKKESDCIVFLDDGNDFERQLINDGFTAEIIQAILDMKIYENEDHELKSKPAYEADVRSYSADKLHSVITGKKTQFGPAIAEKIVDSGKALPPKVISLFNKISAALAT